MLSTECGMADLAESYVLNRLTSPQLQIFEEHLLICAVCRAAVDQMDEFVPVVRAALKTLEDDPIRSERPDNSR